MANEVVYVYEADRLIGTTLADAAGNWIYTPPLADGKHSLKVRQTNSLGETAIASTSFVLDTTPPPVTAALKGAPVATFTTANYTIAPTGSTFVGPAFTTTDDLNKDGFADIAVADASTNNVFIAFNNGQGGFTAVSAVATGNVPSAVSIVDVNADGFGDLVVSESADNTVSVMLGDGTGSFKRTTFAVGNNPQAIRVIDVTSNAKPDMFVANAADNNMTLYSGDGLGGFTKLTTFAVGLNPVAITAGDINGDGKTDVITTNMGDGTVSVLLGKGAGAFGAATSFDVGTAPIFTARSDVNGDNKVDLVVSNSGDSSVSILLGDGLGAFQLQSVVKITPGNFANATTGDLNGDGFVDLAMGSSLALGDGTGNFVVKSSSVSGFVFDINNDGKLDLVRAGAISINTTFGPRGGFISDPTLTGGGDPRAVVRFFESGKQIGSTAANTSGTWTYKPVLADGKHTIVVQETDATGNVGSATVTFTLDTVLPTPTAVLAKDNGASAVDGLTNDLTIKGKAEAGDRVQLFEGTTLLGTATAAADGTWSITPTLTDGIHTVFANETDAAGNIAASGNVVFTLDQTAPRVTTLLSPPTTLGLTAQPGYDPGLIFPNWIASGDLNGDGKIDIVSASNATISVQLGDGLGKLAPIAIVSPTTLSASQSNYVLADINGDGKGDILNLRGFDTIAGGNSEEVFLNDGTGKFAAPIVITLPSGVPFSTLTAGDVNGDKMADLIGVSGGLTMVLLGDGTGKFGAAINSSGGSAGGFLPLLMDANGDGNLDVVTSGFGSGVLTGSRGLFVALNAGAGKFGTAGYTPLLPSFAPSSLYAGDVNGDGVNDLVAVGSLNGFFTAAAVLGDGTGKFGAATYSTIGSQFPVGIVLADVNGDGRADLVSATGQGSTMSVMLSEGSGRFGSPIAVAMGLAPHRLTAADLNGDGKSEIVASANTTSFNGLTSYTPITVALNTTSGSVGNITKAAVLTGVGEIGLPVSIFDGATLLGTVNPDAVGAWTLSPTLTEGKHVIQAKQTDAAGNTGVSTLTVTVKTKAGVVVAALANDTGISAVDGVTSDTTLKGTGGIGETLSVFEGATLLGTTLIDKAGNWSFKPTLADGAHKLTVTGGDVAGNVSAPVTVNLTVDTTPPPLVIVSPAIGFAAAYFSGTAGTTFTSVADFDGDGDGDVIVADNTSFSILLGDGNGGLAKASNTPTSSSNFSTAYVLAEVNGDGKLDVIVSPSNVGGYFANVYLNAGGGKFTASTFTSVSYYQLAAADLNGDGKADLVTQNGNTSVLLNDGTGKFGAATTYAAGGTTTGVAPVLVDLNGDGRAEIVGVTNATINGSTVYSVTVSMNDGTGKFTLGTSRALTAFPSRISTADINGDGRADIIASGFSNSVTNITVLLGDGAGGFRAPILTTVAAAYTAITPGDATGDGRADLLATASDGSVSLMVSDGTGKFSTPVSYGTTSTFPNTLAVGDLDNDGKADVLVGSGSTFDSGSGVFSAKVSTLLNISIGAFGNVVKAGNIKGTAEIGRSVSIFEGAKLLGTATPDAVTGAWSLSPVLTNGKHTLTATQTDAAGNTATGTLTILVKKTASVMTAVLANDTGKSTIDKITNDPTIKGTGGAGDTISIFEGATQVATGIVKLDGTWSIRPNLADGAHTLTIKDTDGAGNVSLAATVTMTLDATAPALTVTPLTTLGFAAPVLTKSSLFAPALFAADMDGDGKLDIVESSGTTLSILPGKGGATFGTEKLFTMAPGGFGAPNRVLLADMNGDGKMDVVAVYDGSPSATVKTYLNDGAGNFGAAISASLATTSTSVFANDVNGDGKADLVSVSGSQAFVQLNDGSAGFSGFSKFSLGNSNANQILLTDLNKDGRPDIVAFSSFSTGITTLLNNGSGAFGAASPFVAVPSPTSQMISTDINNDGNLDLVALPGNTLYTLLGDGTGKFGTPITSKITNSGLTLSAITDVNGDNRPDLIFSVRSAGGVSVHLGDGTGGFENPETNLFGTGSFMYGAITADMNGDGKSDLVTATNAANGQTQVMLNTTTGPFGYVIAAPTLTGKSELGSKVIISEGAKTVGTATQGATGDWSFKASGLTIGAHTLTVTQTDLAGNVTSSPVTITVPPAPGPSGSGPAVVHVVGGGDVTLDPTLTNVTVLLDSATNLTLNQMGFITAIGSGKGDTITAGAANQTLTGRVGADTLVGYSGFGTTFRDTSAGLNGDKIGLFGGGDVINVTDLLPGSAQPLAYKTTASGGILTVTDGTRTTNIGFIGSYAASDFKLGADGQGGSLITFARGS